MTKSCDVIQPREFALRFVPETPDSVIEQAVSYSNHLLSEMNAGLCFFPLQFEKDRLGTMDVKSVYLRADESSWKKFQARGISALPAIVNACRPVMGSRRRPRELIGSDAAAAQAC